MGAAVVLALCLLAATAAAQTPGAAWGSPKLFPPSKQENFTFKYSDQSTDAVIISLNEHSTPIIAMINYTGTEEITSSKETDLKIEYKWSPEEKFYTMAVTGDCDYDVEGSKRYEWSVQIGRESAIVTVNLQNINDNPPQFINQERSCSVPEYFGIFNEGDPFPPEETDCSIIVQDIDGDINTITMTVYENKQVSEFFEVRPKDDPTNQDTKQTYALYLLQALDYEKYAVRILDIRADDGANKADISYVVNVEDLPDTPPVWNNFLASLTIDEKTPTTASVSAHDGDLSIGADISYKLEAKNPDDQQYFSIGQKDGTVNIGSINRDTLKRETFEVELTAYETEDPSFEVKQSLTVIVNDINDNSPEITANSTNTKVNESYSGTFDFFGINIEDIDLGENARYSIELEKSKWSAAFLVVPTSGYQSTNVTISVQDPAKLDFEDSEWRKITLKVIATEDANKTHVNTMEFTIELNDVNDEFPEFTEEIFTAEVKESEDIGTYVTTVNATDKDADDLITYGIMPSTQFQVGDVSGNVTVNRVLDYESTPELTLQLTATDLAGHRAYAELHVTLIDVNDEAPSITATPAITNVTEDSGPDVVIAEISASDPDTEAALKLSIDWENTFATKLGRRLEGTDTVYYEECFQIVISENNGRHATAKLTTTGNPKLNWGMLDTIYLKLVVTDTATAEQYVEEKSTETVTMTITIDDINNNAPAFTEVGQLTVKEEELDYPIGSILAVDADGPGNNNVNYSIKGAQAMYDDYVSIDDKKGEIRTIKKIDCDKEGYDIVFLDVTATDGVNENTTTINVTVIDINDNYPIFGDFNRTVYIPERTGNGEEVLQITATDADRSELYHTIRYQLQNAEENQLYFMVDAETGLLSVRLSEGKELRREDKATFNLEIIARDNFVDNVEGPGGSNSNSTKVTVILQDINDNEPTFDLPDVVMVDGCFVSELGNITEEIKEDTKIGTVKAYDTDAEENGTVSYYILSITNLRTGEEAQLFSVDSDNGTVTTAVDLKNKWGEYDVLFQAIDHGSPPLNGTVTYTFCVIDVNDNDPVFVYPKDEQVIRLQEIQSLGKQLTMYPEGDLPDFIVTDEDDILTGNGKVNLDITDGASDVFRIDAGKDVNTFKLVLIRPLSEVKITNFELQLTATDGGTPARSTSIKIHIKIIIETPQEPIFTEPQWSTSFTENVTGLTESVIIPPATDPNNENLDEDDQEAIYYFIFGGEEELFKLDRDTGNLTLREQLDYEKAKRHTITVIATNSEEKPQEVKNKDSLLECIINVNDTNDMPPGFKKDLFTGGFTIDDSIDKIILTLEATDPDVGDVVTYERISEVSASSSSLASIKDTALELEADTGNVRLKFEPKDETLNGYFSFYVRAKDLKGDEDGHYADAEVQVYVISNIHRVTFQFLNNKTFVDSQNTTEMEDIFTDIFNYECGIEGTKQSADPSSGVALSDTTDVIAHFIDTSRSLPVERDVITQQFYDQTIFSQLQSRFLVQLDLNLKSYQELGNKDATNIEGILTIILIVVSAVLGTMVIVLFVAFFLRTKSLKRRLEALQEIKFGSQNSGLNRVGVAVPNTNKHAVEGSNPMWRTEAVIDYDNVSQGSGDSDMIGIEDNPEFQPSKNKSHFLDGPQPRKVTGILNKEFTFHPDDSDDNLKTESQYLSPDDFGEGKQPRRITETLNNNFILQYDADDINEKTPSVNPLANGNLTNTDNYEGNDNFSFKPADSVPVTQL